MSGQAEEPAGHAPKRCQVVGCEVDVAAIGRAYCLKRRLCEEHLKADAVVRRGHGSTLWRFCFQCGKLEPLAQFDGLKRTCRAQLERRKATDPKRRATWGGGDFKRRLKHATARPAGSRMVVRSDSIGNEHGASRDESDDKGSEVSGGRPLAWHASCSALQLEQALLEGGWPAPATSAHTPPAAPCACTAAAAAAAAAPAASAALSLAAASSGAAVAPPLWGGECVQQQQPLLLPARAHIGTSSHVGGLDPDELEQILEEELLAAVGERSVLAPLHQQQQQQHQQLQLLSTAQPGSGGSALMTTGWAGPARSQALPAVSAAPPAARHGFPFVSQQMGFVAPQQQVVSAPVQHVQLQLPFGTPACTGMAGEPQDARVAKLLQLQHQYGEAKALLDQAEALVGSLVQQQQRILAAAPQGL